MIAALANQNRRIDEGFVAKHLLRVAEFILVAAQEQQLAVATELGLKG